MMNKENLLKIIKEQNINYNNPIRIDTIERIISQARDNRDFYIEQLISVAGNWEASYYLTYYDTNINSIIMVEEVRAFYESERHGLYNDEDLANFIFAFEDAVDVKRDMIRHTFEVCQSVYKK